MYNSTMAEIHARRLARLRQIIEKRFDNNQSAFARAVGLTPSHFGNIFSGRWNLGEHAARKIEAALDLPGGCMDRKLPPGAVPKTPYKARIGARVKVHPYNNPVRELLSAGYTQAEIARQLGVHESTVSRAVKKERRHTARTAA